MAIEPIITGNPSLKNCQKVILYPAFRAISTMTTFALAPIIVPFPPRQAPNANAHQSGMISG